MHRIVVVAVENFLLDQMQKNHRFATIKMRSFQTMLIEQRHIWIASWLLISSLASAADLGICSSEKVAKAHAGDICQSSNNALWKVTVENGRIIYIDLKSKIKITGAVTTSKNFDEAQSACPKGYHIPSGIPGDRTTEVIKLDEDGIQDVIPDMQKYSFWSSSLGPNGIRGAYLSFGRNTVIAYGARIYNFHYAVQCAASL